MGRVEPMMRRPGNGRTSGIEFSVKWTRKGMGKGGEGFRGRGSGVLCPRGRRRTFGRM